MDIPKKIHKIWWQGSSEIPDKYHNYNMTWYSNHPEWDIIIWDEGKIMQFIKNDYPEWEEIYKLYPHMIQKIDLSKYLILYHYGGVYVDMDTISEKPLDEFIEKYPTKGFIASRFRRSLFSPLYLINNGIIISKSKHYILYELLELLKSNYKKNWYHNRDLYILYSTGPFLYTKSILKTMKEHPDNDIEIVSGDLLEGPGADDFGQYKRKGEYITHNHNGSWMTWYFKFFFILLSKIKSFCEKHYIIVICFICLTFKTLHSNRYIIWDKIKSKIFKNKNIKII